MSLASIEADFPSSVEEAGALLGATITKCGREHLLAHVPPPGLPMAFSTVQPAPPSAELFTRLHTLRSFLRSQSRDQPLAAAPSLIAVLMKLLGVSASIAARGRNPPPTPAAAAKDGIRCSFDTPPMLSVPLRRLWVDCIVECHAAGESTSVAQFVRQMIAVAGQNPRSARAAGGVRLAAEDAIRGLLVDPRLASQLAPWSLEILQAASKALRSAGHGEPSYRVLALDMASATAVACRNAFLKTHPMEKRAALVLTGAMEDKAIIEAVRVVKQAAVDKFPEVRAGAAGLAGALAPLLVLAGHTDVPLSSMDEIMALAMRNLDDESPFVGNLWAEALARCLSTVLAYHEKLKASRTGRRNAEDEGEEASAAVEPTRGFGTRKQPTLAQSCTTLSTTLNILVGHFVKAGGELAAARAGGSFSTGGRAIRVGWSLAIVHLLRLESVLGSIGEGRSISMKVAVQEVLDMLGEDMEKQLKSPAAAEAGGAASMFGAAKTKSKADPSLVRLSASRVIRQGLSEVASEPVQLALLHDLLTMVLDQGARPATESSGSGALTTNQLQVILGEVSHLVSTLGEAAASTVEDALAALTFCLSHKDHGVRHEAAIGFVALVASFPSQGDTLLRRTLDEIQVQHAELVALSASSRDQSADQGSGLRMFRRSAQPKEPDVDKTLPHQFAIHGRALMVSLVIKELPRLPGGVSVVMFKMVLSVAEILVSFQFNESLTSANPGAVCLCVRAGFCILCGALAAGPRGIMEDVPLIFDAWQKSCKSIKAGGKHFAPRHDLFCLDAVLASIVAFLKFCPELLLSIPDALSSVTMLLEDSLQLFLPKGRFASIAVTPPILARLESAKASLLEAFAWLPSGSFPMAADGVFGLAATEIRSAAENEITCSILHSLVNREDSLLDAKTACRAKKAGQVGGARDLEETILSLTCEAVGHAEREAVVQLACCDGFEDLAADLDQRFRGSVILSIFAADPEPPKAPTPLHEVGSWRRPFDPSSSSRVRLVDAGIQAFAATFGMKSGKEQQHAMEMLESLVPPFLSQLARTLGMNTTMAEQDRRTKLKEDSAAESNITAVILSCLQALPLHEATHNVPIGLGPQWMNKGKDLLLTLLPSSSTVVRRAAAEGLSLLATLGVSEDAHTLQSAVLHSLDELMQGNKPDGKPRTIALEPVSAARSGSLLTLACIQRTSHNVAERQLHRARERAASTGDDEVKREQDDGLPILQMITRLLPSVAYHGALRDYFIVRAYALHAYAVLLSYSGRLDHGTLDDVDKQLVKKAVELIEGNFAAAWTSASADLDRGQEAEKMASEVAFLSVLVRLMAFVIPFLSELKLENSDVPFRFSLMTTLILESHASHPVVFVECMAFFEVLAEHRALLPPPFTHVLFSENPIFSCIPFIENLELRPGLFSTGSMCPTALVSCRSLRAAVFAARKLTLCRVHFSRLSEMKGVACLVGGLEFACASRYHLGASLLRSLATTKEQELLFAECLPLEREIMDALPTILHFESIFRPSDGDIFLRWLLFARAILAGSSTGDRGESEEAATYSRADVMKGAISRAGDDAEVVFAMSNPTRWQVKSLAAELAAGALDGLVQHVQEKGISLSKDPSFDFVEANRLIATQCREAEKKRTKLPASLLAFHLEDLLSTACMSSAATLDQAELRTLQGGSVLVLTRLIAAFARLPDPQEPEAFILDQFTTQIFSAVKHALSAPDGTDAQAVARLFVAGCDSLFVVAETGLSSDPMVLKRLIRPIVPTFESTPCFGPRDAPAASVRTESSLLVHISKLTMAARLFSGSFEEKVGAALTKISGELFPDSLAIAIQCAAAALDAARLLLGHGYSLAGSVLLDDDDRVIDQPEGGYLFRCAEDLSDSVKELVACSWSSNARFALKLLLSSAVTTDLPADKIEACKSWIQLLVPLLFSGILDCDVALRMNDEGVAMGWASTVSPAVIKLDCLQGLQCLVRECPAPLFEADWIQQIEGLLDRLLNSVLLPAVGATGEEATPGSPQQLNDKQVTEACQLLRHLVSTDSVGISRRPSMLIALLAPVNLLQKGDVDLSLPHASFVITTCLSCLSLLVSSGGADDAITKAMVDLVLTNVLKSGSTVPDDVKKAADDLLTTCLSQSAIQQSQKSRIACDLARDANWEAWSAVALAQDGAAIGKSLEYVGEALRDANDPERQASALAALRGVAQSASAPGPIVGLLFHAVGADILAILHGYGTLQVPSKAQSHRMVAFAESMKLILIGYQQIATGKSDEDVAALLTVVFDAFLAVLRFNGLPNHPSPNAAGDPSLGRMSTQAIVNIARTTPAAFKSCVSQLSDHDRALLEYSVRAEMSGYVVAGQSAEAPKRKIDVSNFRK